MKKQFNDSIIEHLYLHVPFCKHLCNYCDFYKHQESPEGILEFEEYLSKTLLVHSHLLSKHNKELAPLKTLYFGGGTPSLWDGANFLAKEFSKNEINLASECEMTLEVDPGSWREATLNNWKDFGVNRVSIGTQSMNPSFIEVMDRPHTLDETLETISFVKSNWKNFTVDFMLGLPFSKEKNRDVIKELDQLLEHEPAHVSLYILKARKNYIHSQSLPEDDYIEEEYLKVCDYLKGNGFNHYEVSNFSKPGFESQHNLAYWKYKSVAALGPSSTGLFTVDEKAIRYKWKPKSFDTTLEKLEESDVLLEKVFLHSRCSEGLDANLFGEHRHLALEIFKSWQKRNLGKIESERIYLDSEGYIIQDSLLDELFQKIPF